MDKYIHHIIKLAQLIQTPILLAWQVDKETVLKSFVGIPEKTNERLYTASQIIDDGDPCFTTIYSKTEQKYQEVLTIVHEIFNKLHNKLFLYDTHNGDNYPLETFHIERSEIIAFLRKYPLSR